MARTIRRILFLGLLVGACTGGCFFPTDPEPPPGPVMLPGIWEANLPGGQQSFTRALGASGQLEDTITGEQPVEIPIGAEFDDAGRLSGLRVLGAAGYIELVNPGDRIDEMDWWTVSPRVTQQHSSAIARRHVLEAVDYAGDQVTIRLASTAEAACGTPLQLPTEIHEYTFVRIDGRVSVSAFLTSFTRTGEDGSGRGSNWVLGPVDAVAKAEAPAPIVGPWDLAGFPRGLWYPFQFPDLIVFDRLGRLVAGNVTYPGDLVVEAVELRPNDVRENTLEMTGLSFTDTGPKYTFVSRTWPLAAAPNEGPNEDTVTLEVTGPNSSPLVHELRLSRSFNSYPDGTRELIQEQTVETSVALAPHSGPPQLPGFVSASAVPDAVPELAGAWEGGVAGNRTMDGVEVPMARRIGIEFDGEGRFSRVRLPHSTGYVAPEAAPANVLTFTAPILLEYRPGGAHLVLAERHHYDCSAARYRAATYDIDVSLAEGGAAITYREHYYDTGFGEVEQALAYDFEGASTVALRTSPIPVALTGWIDVVLEGTWESHDPPTPATQHTRLYMDSLGRLRSLTSASGTGRYGGNSSGPVHTIRLADAEIATESGFVRSAHFFHAYYDEHNSWEGATADEVFTLTADETGTFLRVGYTRDSFSQPHGGSRRTWQTRFVGSARLSD